MCIRDSNQTSKTQKQALKKKQPTTTTTIYQSQKQFLMTHFLPQVFNNPDDISQDEFCDFFRRDASIETRDFLMREYNRLKHEKRMITFFDVSNALSRNFKHFVDLLGDLDTHRSRLEDISFGEDDSVSREKFAQSIVDRIVLLDLQRKIYELNNIVEGFLESVDRIAARNVSRADISPKLDRILRAAELENNEIAGHANKLFGYQSSFGKPGSAYYTLPHKRRFH
eukprot:TRINITY_DN5751_c0_g1_i1.p2 TRINITY_DN5751_c0_g1~~TRINITY_DN5751_c0_g1_i1.p2  ORF type:complete len:226 (-),score=32.92 TRINITY_DN5751_c0_g1_i1:425-1102(-)